MRTLAVRRARDVSKVGVHIHEIYAKYGHMHILHIWLHILHIFVAYFCILSPYFYMYLHIFLHINTSTFPFLLHTHVSELWVGSGTNSTRCWQ